MYVLGISCLYLNLLLFTFNRLDHPFFKNRKYVGNLTSKFYP